MKIKKVSKFIALFLTFCLMLGVLAGCSTKLSGTYTSKGLISQSFTFEKDNQVTISAFGIEASGTYAIKDDKITITYGAFGLSYDWEKSFKKDGNSIYIDGTEFVKE